MELPSSLTLSTKPENVQGCLWDMAGSSRLLCAHSSDLLPSQHPSSMVHGQTHTEMCTGLASHLADTAVWNRVELWFTCVYKESPEEPAVTSVFKSRQVFMWCLCY